MFQVECFDALNLKLLNLKRILNEKDKDHFS